MSARTVDILFFEGCPNVETTVSRVADAIGAAGGASVRMIRVETEEHAKEARFIGSPSVRVDDVDVDPSAHDRHDFGLQCRVYDAGGRLEGAPPVEWIRSALGREPGAISASPATAHDCCARATKI